jgi:CDP-diacylglycerol--glycerol-3-phosphate 3-phosphatidyltransferase
MKLRYIPNALSLTRLLLCIPLAILSPFSIVYIVIFIAACVTDTLDGQLARRIKSGASELGAILDSIADVCLVAVIIFAIMPRMVLWGWLWIAFVCVLALKVTVSTGIGFVKFKEVVSLHTLSFKALVTALFCYPLIYFIIGSGTFINIFSTVLISCALLVVIEEILIISMLKRPDRNIKSIFGVGASNQAASRPT